VCFGGNVDLSIRNYSVLKGLPRRGEVAFDKNWKNPHYRLYLDAGIETAQVDINIESEDGSEVLYLLNRAFQPPNAALNDLGAGLNPLDNVQGTLALDYVREKIGGRFMVSHSDMTPLPIPKHGSNNLNNEVIQFLDALSANRTSIVYAFGSAYSDSNGVTGIHDIHMNQGNPSGDFEMENGIWQDGALFVNASPKDQWTALFIAFQTQSWQTDDKGNPLPVKASRQTR
jgi:uncharacterized protein YukJ